MKRTFWTLFIAALLCWISWVRTDGFSPSLIRGKLSSQAIAASPEILAILSQPFEYLGKGRQCFVFQSRDQKYVLKFFNQRYIEMPLWRFFNREKEEKKRALRRYFSENSYEIAYREFGDEILFFHRGISRDLPTLLIRDAGKRVFEIDLNQTLFVLQKKGEPFYSSLHAIYQKEGLRGLCREIDVFTAAISKRISRQIADADSDVEHNWGYVDGHLFHLDPGRLYYDPDLKDPKRQAQEWQTATRRFTKWLQMHYPEAAALLNARSKDRDLHLDTYNFSEL